MKLFYYFSLLVILSSVYSGCHTKKPVVNNQNCSQTGIVTDFAGLDGCQLLIVTEDGEKLLPASVSDENFVLKSGQKIRFDYKEREAMSICMAEDKTVEITCIELAVDFKEKQAECLDITNPMTVPWMKTGIEKYTPFQIIRYPDKSDSWVYLFKGNNVFLYDCMGRQICKSRGRSLEKCIRFIKNIEKGKIIWQDETIEH